MFRVTGRASMLTDQSNSSLPFLAKCMSVRSVHKLVPALLYCGNLQVNIDHLSGAFPPRFFPQVHSVFLHMFRHVLTCVSFLIRHFNGGDSSK